MRSCTTIPALIRSKAAAISRNPSPGANAIALQVYICPRGRHEASLNPPYDWPLLQRSSGLLLSHSRRESGKRALVSGCSQLSVDDGDKIAFRHGPIQKFAINEKGRSCGDPSLRACLNILLDGGFILPRCEARSK